MRLAAGLRPDPLGELKRSPRPPSRKKGPTSKGGGKGAREGREEEGRERRKEGEGRGREGAEPPLQPVITLTTGYLGTYIVAGQSFKCLPTVPDDPSTERSVLFSGKLAG